jgi:hypothetical protein
LRKWSDSAIAHKIWSLVIFCAVKSEKYLHGGKKTDWETGEYPPLSRSNRVAGIPVRL